MRERALRDSKRDEQRIKNQRGGGGNEAGRSRERSTGGPGGGEPSVQRVQWVQQQRLWERLTFASPAAFCLSGRTPSRPVPADPSQQTVTFWSPVQSRLRLAALAHCLSVVLNESCSPPPPPHPPAPPPPAAAQPTLSSSHKWLFCHDCGLLFFPLQPRDAGSPPLVFLQRRRWPIGSNRFRRLWMDGRK